MRQIQSGTIYKLNKYFVFAFFIYYFILVVTKLIYAFPDFSEGDWKLTMSFKLSFLNLVIYSLLIYFTIDKEDNINKFVSMFICFYSIVNLFLAPFVLLLIMNKL
jgi:hypothetical protein